MTDRQVAGKSFSKRPDQVQDSAADASLMRAALAEIAAKESKAMECVFFFFFVLFVFTLH